MYLSLLRQQLLDSKQRVLLHLQGSQQWGLDWLQQQLPSLEADLELVWFGDNDATLSSVSSREGLDARLKQYKKYLGQELDLVIINAYSGFNPDALGALAGVVRLGGICILLTPESDDWRQYPDPELARFCTEPFVIEELQQGYSQRAATILEASEQVARVSNHADYLPISTARPQQLRFEQQSNLVAELTKQLLASSNTNLAVTLTADRGRGKTSALGLVSANLLQHGSNKRILVTAPLLSALTPLFSHFKRQCEQRQLSYQATANRIETASGVLEFIAPDQLMLLLPQADWVFIDEAAAIPAQMLTPVLAHYEKLVFATTVHGYEGTGRGFEYKLKPAIYQQFAQVQEYQLSQPMRWYQGDWLEATVNRLLALDVSLPELTHLASNLAEPKAQPRLNEQAKLRLWSTEELVNNEAKLSTIFALLVHAHYRTTPADLRQILDAPDIHLATLEHQGVTLAAALIGKEGNIPAELAELVYQGRRRPRGHLLPQSLLAHAGFIDAGQYSYHRIIRIATHPQLQRQGLGLALLAQIELWSQQQGIDLLATSYGYAQNLVRFWQRAGMQPVRLGLKAEASTGEFSLLMLKPLHAQVQPFVAKVHSRFQQTFAAEQVFKLRDSSIHLPYEPVHHQLEHQDLMDLAAFCQHFRGLNTCLLAMVRFVYTNKARLTIPQLVLDKVNPDYTHQALLQKYNLAGEKALVARLRELWQGVLKQHGGIEVDTQTSSK